MRTAAASILLLCLACQQSGAQASPFTLKDQYGTEVKIGTPSTDWTLIIYADREGNNFSDNWEKGLRTLPHCRIVFAADLRSVPFFMKPTVAGMFRGKGPNGKDKGPVLLDWDEKIGRAFGHTPSVANVYLFDPSGVMRAKDSGKGGTSDLGRFISTAGSLLTQTQ